MVRSYNYVNGSSSRRMLIMLKAIRTLSPIYCAFVLFVCACVKYNGRACGTVVPKMDTVRFPYSLHGCSETMCARVCEVGSSLRTRGSGIAG